MTAPAPAPWPIDAVSASTMNTAIGSFRPDSISSVAATRSFRRSPTWRSSENTAAASVDATIAPSSSAWRQPRCITGIATSATIAAVTSTPTLASSTAGVKPLRKTSMRVLMPPSSRMTASEALPTQAAKIGLSKCTPPGPSSPTSMPATRNTSRKDRPKRVEKTPASRLRNTSSPPASNSRLNASIEEAP